MYLEHCSFKWLQVDLANKERLLIRTTAFVEELRKRMYTKVSHRSVSDHKWKVSRYIWFICLFLDSSQSYFINWICFWTLQVILMDHVDWLDQEDIDILCAALRDQVKVRMERKYDPHWSPKKPFSMCYNEDLKFQVFYCGQYLQPGGRVIWRSASRRPKYAKCIEDAGFNGEYHWQLIYVNLCIQKKDYMLFQLVMATFLS